MQKLTGSEEFTLNGSGTGITVSDLWSWAYSDLFNNTSRGVAAEFLVYASLYTFLPPPDQKMRVDWTPYDLTSPSGRKIEVKSAAYLQSWDQDYYSKILWDIAPKRAWSPSDGYSPEVKRHSDLYVFCLYTALTRDQSILNLDLWEFYVLPTRILDEKMPTQKKISLPSLLKLMPVKASFAELGNAIETTELLRT